jgi:tetratricopeptide (TPR) repeat protein
MQQLDENHAEIYAYKNSDLSEEDLEALAENYFEIGKWDDAFITYKKIINSNNKNSNVFYGMALTQFMLNNNEEALNLLLHSFDLNSGMEVNFLDDFPYFESTQLYIKLTDAI